MKCINYIVLGIAGCCLLSQDGLAQERSALSLNLGYFSNNDRTQYLVANAKTRVNGKFTPRDSVPVRFFISGESPGNLIGQAMTNSHGDAILFLPPAAKTEWDKSPKQHFVAIADSSSTYEGATAEADIAKAKIELDTSADKNIVATVLEQTATGWVPVMNTDVILAVKRMGSNLNLSNSPTYTTDSLGKVSVDYTLAGLPGDDSGNIVLLAKLDASDQYGTITREKIVPWGVAPSYVSDFDKHSLFARRGLAPWWLRFIAYSILLAVWGVIIHLFFQIRKIRRIGLHSPVLSK